MTPSRVRRAFDRAAITYDQAATVQQQTLHALIEALPTELAGPATLLDIGCGTGFALPFLEQRYPGSRLIGIDFSEAMLRTLHDAGQPAEIPGSHERRAPAAPRPAARHDLHRIAADAARLPLADGCADLAFSSMTWQWCPLPQVLGEAHRVLKAGGTLAFSTLTTGTYRELAAAFSGIDQHPHTLRLLDADEVVAAVRTAGFADLAVRNPTRTARYVDLPALLHAIRATGANEVSGRRRPGLLGKTAWKTIVARYAAQADAEGLLPLTYEVLEVVGRR